MFKGFRALLVWTLRSGAVVVQLAEAAAEQAFQAGSGAIYGLVYVAGLVGGRYRVETARAGLHGAAMVLRAGLGTVGVFQVYFYTGYPFAKVAQGFGYHVAHVVGQFLGVLDVLIGVELYLHGTKLSMTGRQMRCLVRGGRSVLEFQHHLAHVLAIAEVAQ